MRNGLLSSTAVGIGSSSPVDRWINENSQKSICCRFTGFLLWIVGSLVKQMPKDSWIVSYKIADLLARCASHRDIPMSWLPEYCQIFFSMLKETFSHGPLNSDVWGWLSAQLWRASKAFNIAAAVRKYDALSVPTVLCVWMWPKNSLKPKWLNLQILQQ